MPLLQPCSFASTPFVFAAVPTAKRAQTLVMPGTLPTHQTTDDMLASTSESLSASRPVGTHSSSSATGSGGSSGSSSTGGGLFGDSAVGSVREQQHQLTAASFDNTMSADTSGRASQGDTVRMGKMLETQPKARTAAHHRVSNG